jgi:hypothetical protein
MNQYEIVGPEIQRYSGFQVCQFAQEGEREPMKPRNFHSEGQILPLYIRRANLAEIGNAEDSVISVPETRGGAYRPAPGFSAA